MVLWWIKQKTRRYRNRNNKKKNKKNAKLVENPDYFAYMMMKNMQFTKDNMKKIYMVCINFMAWSVSFAIFMHYSSNYNAIYLCTSAVAASAFASTFCCCWCLMLITSVGSLHSFLCYVCLLVLTVYG